MNFVKVSEKEYKSFISHISNDYIILPDSVEEKTSIVNKDDYIDVIAIRSFGVDGYIYEVKEDLLYVINEYQYKPNADNVRIAKVRNDNKEWIETNPLDLKEGMIFRMFEPDGSPVSGINADIIFTAMSDAYVDKNGVIGINMSFGVDIEGDLEEENND